MSTYGFGEADPQASLTQLAAMLRSAVDAIISIDAFGIIESINPATESLFGYTATELIGRNVKMLMPEPYRSQHDGYIRQYRHTGQRKIIGIGREATGRRKDGSTFSMHLSVSEYEIDGKRHFAGIAHDLTAQKQTEAESNRPKTLLQAIVNHAPQAIILADLSHAIYLVNSSVSRIFGYAPEELIGKNARILYEKEEDYERVNRLRLDFTAPDIEGAADPVQMTCRRRNGESFPAELIATVVRDPNRNVLGVMKLIRDITQQLKQEEALRQAQRMEALGQIAGGIAHDFNNLLTIIMGSHELFETCSDRPEAADYIRRANDAAEMGARLTSRLLSFSRQRKPEPAIINLNEHVLGMMDLLRRTLGETIDISTSLASDLGSVRADPSEIENAVLNLAINARDAMPLGGRVFVETANVSLDTDGVKGARCLVAGKYVRLSVSDTGCGMPPEVVARAFEPFFTTKPPGRGTELGLAGYDLARRARELRPEIKILLTSGYGYDAALPSTQGIAGSQLEMLRKPYKQADLARAVREILEA